MTTLENANKTIITVELTSVSFLFLWLYIGLLSLVSCLLTNQAEEKLREAVLKVQLGL